MSKSNKTDKRQQLTSSSDEEFDPNKKDGDYDLFMDEEERKKFDKMTEKEREIEIYKRLEQREIMKTREQIKKKLEMAAGKKTDVGERKQRKRKISEGSNDNSDEDDDSTSEEGEADSTSDESDKDKKPKSARSKAKIKTEPNGSDDEIDTEYHKPSEVASKQNKKKAMADLLSKRRNRKQAEEKRRKEATHKAALDLDEIFGNDNEDGKSMSSSSSSSSSSSRSSSPDLTKSRSPTPELKQEIQTKDELIRCQLFRRKLAKFVHAPFFEKTVVGCFVRISIGPNKTDGTQVYRAAQIVEVVETAKIYEVEPNTDIRTNKGLRLKVCDSDSMRVYRLEFISNSLITDSEFAFWLNKMRSSNTPLPTVDFVDRKRKEMIEALNYNYNEAEINLLIKEKQRFKKQPTNFAFQKAELLKMKEHAEQAGDPERVRDLQQQVNELEEKAKKIEHQRTKNLSAVNFINQRNRDHMKQTFLGSGISRVGNQGKDDDPFTRKSARMKMVSGAVKAKLNAVNAGSSSLDTIMSSQGSTSSSDTFCSPSKKMQLPSAHDLFNAHGININIDIKMPAMASGSFRAPPIVDTHIHPQQKSTSSRTLTLEEYKRRRGLV